MKITNKVKILFLIIVGLLFSFNLTNVNAQNVPTTVKVKAKSSLYYYTEKKKTDYINGYNFYRKELTDGTLAYCSGGIKNHVPSGKTLTLKGEVKDKGLAYIIKNGYPNKSITGNALKDYYITQSAIWRYFDETKGTKNWSKSTFTASSTGMKKNVYNLVQNAKKARNITNTSSISATIDNNEMTIVDNEFVSKEISVSLVNTKSTYTVSLLESPNNTKIKSINGEEKTTFNSGEKFIVTTPINNITGSIKLKITSTGIDKKLYEYTTKNSYYQDIILVTQFEVETGEVSTNLDLNFNLNTKVKISKQDITSKEEVPGATLIIKDKDGNVVTRWVSENTPHYIENLLPGDYTLTESIAPHGYKLSSETVEFTVKTDGSVTSVVMYNDPEITRVKISKQDMANGEEVAGATLVIKDKDGNEVTRWVSTDKPHYIEGLKEGKYTLTEEVAPKGYKLSSETVEFELLADGTVKSVTMLNEREVTKVKISKQDMANGEEVAGATLIIKDKDGNEVTRWVSTDKPHYIEGLKEGKYTLTEEVAPKGYKLSSETVEFELLADGTVKSVTMLNEREVTKVKISKQDMANGEEVAGATLIIKDKDGNEVTRWVSTDKPHYIEGLKEGKYTLTEEVAPKGYKLSSETVEFELLADGTVKSVTMLNEREVTKVKISKQDMANGEELPGATLIIKDKDGNEVTRWVSTDKPHYIEGLKEGKYTLTEEVAPKGYKLSSETVEFELLADGTVKSVTMLNERETTKVRISKKDITNGEELPGATLVIRDSDGKEVARWISEDTPKYIEGLPEGSYTLEEIQAPNGYKLSTEKISFRLTRDGKVQEVLMYNEREITRVRISKQDLSNKTELPGATLIIKDNDGNEVARWISTDKPHYIEGLKEGKYTLEEIQAPNGYKLSTEKISFTLKRDGKVNLVTMYNEMEITRVNISKLDKETKNNLAGATLVIKDKDGNVVDSWTSENTSHYIEGLPEGSYTLEEIQAPNGYKLSTEKISFTLKRDGNTENVVMYNEKETTKVKISKKDITNGEELEGATLVIRDKNGNEVTSFVSTNEPKYIEGLEPGEYTLSETTAPDGYELSTETVKFTLKADGTVQTVVMYNNKITIVTKVKISKKDITNGEEVEGATLVIKDNDGNEIASWISTNEPKYIEGLEPGEYTLSETTAPDGYRLSTETINFKVNEDGSLTSVVMYNSKKVVKLSVSKQDLETKKELVGATLIIKNSNGEVVDKWISSTEPHYNENLKEGEYTLIEESAPGGYKLNTNPIKFTLKDSDQVQKVIIYNEKKEVTKVRISKQDLTNKTELKGATLIVRDSNGDEVDRWISGANPHYIEGLAVGEYTLTELIAPSGYILSSETIRFTIKDDGSVTDVVMYNELKPVTKVLISKLDAETKNILAGATLVIKDSKGKIIDKWISGTNSHYIEGIDAGEYTLIEEKAPAGYALNKEVVKFNVNDDGSITNVVMYNTKLITIPITDLNVSQASLIIGTVITFIGASILVFYKKFYI